MTKNSNILDVVKKESPLLFWIAIFHVFTAVLCAFGLIIDDSTLLGVNVWLKPLKFSISIAIYLITVGFLITFYPYSNRKKGIINNTVAISLLIEIFIIILQAARGVQSHFNMATSMDQLLFGLMGLFIGINTVIIAMFIFDTIRLKLKTSKLIQWSILMGWLIVFFGSWVGGQMIQNRAHTVGVPDGSPGLPLVNWSTIAGDLRVSHFFALHAIQIIPLFAYLISKKWKTTENNQLMIVTLFGVLFAGWICYTFYQAKMGVPFLG